MASVILGSRAILERDAWLPQSGRVRLIAGRPISTEEISRGRPEPD